jgi:tellurite resistance protein TerC
MLAIDLGLFNKKDHKVSMKKAAMMSFIWVSFAIGFYFLLLTNGELLHDISNFALLQEITTQNLHNISLIPDNFEASLSVYKQNLALEFLTGYVIEYALSVDNIFVMVLIFSAFGVDEKYYHRVLFWGIIGAVLMRFLFIFLGSTLINEFGWILYIFGAFLIYTGVGMLLSKDEEEKIDTENHKVVRFASKYFSVYPEYAGNKFFIKIDGKKMVTPLFIVLLIVQFTDLIFAVDSIPAIFGITKDPYIVVCANIFALMGLRQLYFLLQGLLQRLVYLSKGLSFILAFIGVKMIIEAFHGNEIHELAGVELPHISIEFSLGVIVTTLIVTAVASLTATRKDGTEIV